MCEKLHGGGVLRTRRGGSAGNGVMAYAMDLSELSHGCQLQAFKFPSWINIGMHPGDENKVVKVYSIVE